MIRKYWIALTCFALLCGAYAFNGVMDTLQFHYDTSIFPRAKDETFLWGDRQYWDPDLSWENKYKDWPLDPRPAFPGATTWLVGLTDGWHLAQTAMFSCFILAVLLPLIYLYRLPRWVILAGLVPVQLGGGLIFTIFYGYLLVRTKTDQRASRIASPENHAS